jgi:hypothetical protein
MTLTNQDFNYRVLHPVAHNINCKLLRKRRYYLQLNQDLIEEKIKRRLNSGNNIFSSHLISKYVKIRISMTYNFACGSVWV